MNSLVQGQSYDCPIVAEVTLNDMINQNNKQLTGKIILKYMDETDWWTAPASVILYVYYNYWMCGST